MASAYYKNTDIWAWIQSLPPLIHWKKDSMSLCICSSNSSMATLSLNITKNISHQTLTFAVFANFHLPISLWTSKPVYISNTSANLLSNENAVYHLMSIIIQDVLKYGPTKQIYPLNIPKINPPKLKQIFNVSLLTLVFVVCVYEAPTDLRFNCLKALKDQLSTTESREASKDVIRLLGSHNEEQWMRCLSLAVTNWKMELKAVNCILKGPSPLFSHGLSTLGLWKVQLYCPIITMEIENSSGSADERLAFSLNYQHLEGVIQLNHKVIVRDKWIEVMVNIDNLRLDVVPLVSDKILNDRGTGPSEKHFPSRISLQLTPEPQTKILSVSVSKSSENPKKEIEIEKTIEGSFEPPNKVGLQVSAGETTTTIFQPWKFEETAMGDSGGMNWFLHDSTDGREVFSTTPSPMTLFQPKAWFRHRYSRAYRPFTRQGGVIFAGDHYGETVCWKVEKSALGRSMEWELAGCIGLTYWPNKYRTFYNETKRAEFKETLHLALV